MNWGESLNSGLLQQSRWFVCICPFGKSGSLEMRHTELFLRYSWITRLSLRNVCCCMSPEEGQWVCIYLVMHLLSMTGLSLHERIQQIPGFPGQSSVHPALQPWYQQWAEKVGKVRALLSIPREERVFGQAVIPILKYLKCSKKPRTPNYWVNKGLGKTHVEKTAWDVFQAQKLQVRSWEHPPFPYVSLMRCMLPDLWRQGCGGYKNASNPVIHSGWCSSC